MLHIKSSGGYIADVVFREVGKSINVGKVVIDETTYNFEGKLTCDKIEGIFNNGTYSILYTQQEGPDMQLIVNMQTTGDPLMDFNATGFRWNCEEDFLPDIELEFKRVYTNTE